MIIGLYDFDMDKYLTVPFNLELMKLSSYYKKKREIVRLSPVRNPEKFSKFIIRKDYDDGDFPAYNQSNIECGGLAYTGGIYVPMEEEIELSIPDNHIYETYHNRFDSKQLSRNFNLMMNAAHLRLSLDGRLIWDKAEQQLPRDLKTHSLYFHDYDLGLVDGSLDAIKELANSTLYKNGYIDCKFPVQTHSTEELIEWLRLERTGSHFYIQTAGIVPNKSLPIIVQEEKKKEYQQRLFYYIPKGSLSDEEFIQYLVPQLYQQIIFLRTYCIDFRLKINEMEFADERLVWLMELLNAFGRIGVHLKKNALDMDAIHRIFKRDTMWSYLAAVSNFSDRAPPLPRNKIQGALDYTKEHNPDLYEQFHTLSRVKLKESDFY
jgi:hypothetical protein